MAKLLCAPTFLPQPLSPSRCDCVQPRCRGPLQERLGKSNHHTCSHARECRHRGVPDGHSLQTGSQRHTSVRKPESHIRAAWCIRPTQNVLLSRTWGMHSPVDRRNEIMMMSWLYTKLLLLYSKLVYAYTFIHRIFSELFSPPQCFRSSIVLLLGYASALCS